MTHKLTVMAPAVLNPGSAFTLWHLQWWEMEVGIQVQLVKLVL